VTQKFTHPYHIPMKFIPVTIRSAVMTI